MNNYFKGMVYGLPKPQRDGYNTSSNKKRIDKEYVFKVTIKGVDYYKVHIARCHNGKYVSKIKYFKTLKEAKLFRDMLNENRYF